MALRDGEGSASSSCVAFHRNTLVDVEAHDGDFHVYDLAGEPLTVIPRTSTKEISRFKAYGWKHKVG